MAKYLVAVLIILLFGCTHRPYGKALNCDPNIPVTTIQLYNSDVVVKGYDENCDTLLDYWQHYENGHPVGNKIKVGL